MTADDASRLLQSPAAQGMARSLSDIVQQLFSDDQLSGECARALSLQLGSADVADLQQLQGAAMCSGLDLHCKRHYRLSFTVPHDCLHDP